MWFVSSLVTLLSVAPSPIVVLDSPIAMDGVPLEVEDFANRAMVAESVFEPAPGLAPQGRALTAWAFDERYLWVGVRVFFKNPRRPLGPVDRRDSLPNGDRITLRIDSAGKGERAFQFATNSAGVIRDLILQAPERDEDAWDSMTDIATTEFDDGWFAEFQIPLQELSIPKLQGTWGINVFFELWKEEQRLSLFPVDVGNRNAVAKVGYVDVALNDLPDYSLRLLPAATVAASSEDSESGCDSEFAKGRFTTCKTASSVGLSGSLTLGNHTDLQFAVNPDFSQVEADVPQVALNERFALFYPEKRPFFTRVGALVPGRIDIFYTRSIGQPLVGLQARHRRGDSSVIALSAFDLEPQGSIVDDRIEALDASETLTNLGRYEQTLDMGRLGATYIDRLWFSDSDVEGYNGVVGFDGNLRPTREWSLQWELLGSATTLQEDDAEFGGADRIFLQYNDGDYRWFAKHEYVHSDFRAEAGFIPRLGYHQVMTKVDLYFRDVGVMNLGSPGMYVSSYLNERGDAIEHFAGGNFYIDWAGHIWTFTKYEVRPELIESSGDWLVPQQFDMSIGSQVTSWLKLKAETEFGTSIIRDEDLLGERDPYLGRSIDYGGEFVARPISSLVLAGGLQGRAIFNDSNRLIGEDRFLGGMGEWYLSRDDSLRLIYQQSLDKDKWSADVLATHRPVSGFIGYLGYRADYEDDTLVHRVFTKVSYQFGM